MLPDEDVDRTEALAELVMEYLQKATLPPNVKRLSNMKNADGVVRGNVEFASGAVEPFRVKVDHRHDTVHSAVQETIDMLRKHDG